MAASGSHPGGGGGPRTGGNASIGHYILGKTIGEGTFGKVKLGTHILTGEKVAVKILEKERIVDVADVERVAREIHILKLIRHPHIIQLYEIIETPKQLYLIMEFASGGELFDYIVASCRVKEREAVKFFHQILNGVEKIHSMRVVHRDLKPENLLLDSQKHIKIVDFGLSNTYKPGQLLKTACGSPCYAAPEMIAGKKYNPMMCDIWSCGVILFALVCGFLPFEDQNTAALYKKILGADYQTPKFISSQVTDLIAGMLTTEPAKRLTAPKIKQHPWYRGLFGNVTELSERPTELQFMTGRGCEVPDCPYCVHSDSKEGSIPIEEDVLTLLDKYGFPREYAVKCLEMNKHNHVTTTYYLLARRKFRAIQVSEEENGELQAVEHKADPFAQFDLGGHVAGSGGAGGSSSGDHSGGVKMPPGAGGAAAAIEAGIPIYAVNQNPQIGINGDSRAHGGTSSRSSAQRPAVYSVSTTPRAAVSSSIAQGYVTPRGGVLDHAGQPIPSTAERMNNINHHGTGTTSHRHDSAAQKPSYPQTHHSTRPSSTRATSSSGRAAAPSYMNPTIISQDRANMAANAANMITTQTTPRNGNGNHNHYNNNGFHPSSSSTSAARGASVGPPGGGIGSGATSSYQSKEPRFSSRTRGAAAGGANIVVPSFVSPAMGVGGGAGGGEIVRGGGGDHRTPSIGTTKIRAVPLSARGPMTTGPRGPHELSNFAGNGGPTFGNVGSGVNGMNQPMTIATRGGGGGPAAGRGGGSRGTTTAGGGTPSNNNYGYGYHQPPMSARGTYGGGIRPVAYSNCDVISTNSKNGRQIAQELQRALTTQRVMFKQTHGNGGATVLRCQKQYVKFDLEISAGMEGQHGDGRDSHMVKFKRTGGDLNQYKELCHRLLTDIKV
mmetsp:Transcript_14012/g.34679  ORF Transcript_14012/g.34679 Transcript_14012/m.34679 type:complete len:892 (+) Transcript_14012:417-3092(+)|eukprot:CAMPEP_0178996278 /NCGR_PEP_ID=MMETSP0795-20121207/8287_1 /TAXON_ID=88552 /ORGANISM="Amoebophrya sp., Strain Ameob2" /LENGTH=891 /DNA_ID=CAMNT_0020688665 /DNA_START=344 /DNA_END=3019 /DNA_ORIENTATION=+